VTAVEPFPIQVPEAELADLRRRLRATRWPDEAPDPAQGVALARLEELCRYWAEEYDWRVVERRLNELGSFRATVGGLGIHLLHVRSGRPDALPLVLTHGWPGSVLEFLDVVEPLAEAGFDVVVPALPGYGFSERPRTTGWGVERIAAAWAELMAGLGYPRYGAAGSDWGTSVTAELGRIDAAHLVGIHLVPPLAPPDPTQEYTAQEREAVAALARAAESGDGYSAQQSTKPQTLGYGLTDSPAGLCAWITEKFAAWCDGDPDEVLGRDRMLDGVTLYWLTRTAASSARLYWESIREVQALFTGGTPVPIDVPTGATVFPRENPRPSRRWAARRFPDIRWWGEPERGGHFGAWEQPETFVAELTGFFALVR